MSADRAIFTEKPRHEGITSFNYSDSLKYEIEKDYINNYGNIPLESKAAVDLSQSGGKTDVQVGGRLATLRQRFSVKVSKESVVFVLLSFMLLLVGLLLS